MLCFIVLNLNLFALYLKDETWQTKFGRMIWMDQDQISDIEMILKILTPPFMKNMIKTITSSLQINSQIK